MHISEFTYNLIKDSYEVEDGHGADRNDYLKEQNIKTYLITEAKENLEERKSEVNIKRAVSLFSYQFNHFLFALLATASILT